MKIGGFLTIKNPIERQDPYLECIKCMVDFLDEVLIVDGFSTDGSIANIKEIFGNTISIIQNNWPEEFDWKLIGKIFDLGYQNCDSDFVLRFDCDYFLHENDFEDIRKFLDNCTTPVACMPKKQFLLADEYRVKSLIPIAFNKKKYGDRIKLDSGGDLCQPSLDGVEVDKEKMPIISRKVPVMVSGVSNKQIEERLPNVQEEDGILYMMDKGIHIWNYDFSLKEKEVIKKDFARFARAWYRTFGKYTLGGPDDESAFNYFLKMQTGRYRSGGWASCQYQEHPKYIQEKIKNITPEQFGYNMFGNIGNI